MANDSGVFDWKGGEEGTTLTQRIAAFLANPGAVVEALFGVDNLRDVFVLQRAIKAAKTVCRIPQVPATGFLIGEQLLITNNHVLQSQERAQSCTAQFNFQVDEGNISMPADEFALDPGIFFMTDIPLDFTVVGVTGRPGVKWGFIRLAKTSPKPGNAAIVIQHPDGGHKKIAFGDNEIKAITDNETRIQYLTDTKPGSSGSPVFDDGFNLVGLHHKSLLAPDRNSYYRNQAVHINSIIDKLPAGVTS